MAELNITLNAQAEITNKDEIRSIFKNFENLSSNVKSALITAIGPNAEPIELKLGDSGEMGTLLSDIKTIVEENQLLILGMGGGGGGGASTPSSNIISRVTSTKGKMNKDIISVLGADPTKFLDEVKAMETNPKKLSQTDWRRDMKNANAIVKRIDEAIELIKGGKNKDKGKVKDLTKNLDTAMYKSTRERFGGHVSALVERVKNTPFMRGKSDTRNADATKGIRGSENIAQAIAQDWSFGQEMLQNFVGNMDIDMEELLSIPEIRKAFQEKFSEEVTERSKLGTIDKRSKPSSISESFDAVIPSLIESAQEGRQLGTSGQLETALIPTTSRPEVNIDLTGVKAELVSSVTKGVTETLSTSFENMGFKSLNTNVIDLSKNVGKLLGDLGKVVSQRLSVPAFEGKLKELEGKLNNMQTDLPKGGKAKGNPNWVRNT